MQVSSKFIRVIQVIGVLALLVLGVLILTSDQISNFQNI